jgi:hypothetical protein
MESQISFQNEGVILKQEDNLFNTHHPWRSCFHSQIN